MAFRGQSLAFVELVRIVERFNVFFSSDAPVDAIIKSDLLATVLNLARIPRVSEKNRLNKAYVMSRFSPVLDDISNEVSTNATISDNKQQSASGSPSTVDSGYDSRSLNSDYANARLNRQLYSRISPSRKRGGSLKTIKQKRNLHQLRVNYSPDKIVKSQKDRLELLVKKVREESERMGDFIRIFPRPESRNIYGPICEDAGSEQWDQKLGNLLFGTSAEISQREFEQFHSQMLNAKEVCILGLYIIPYLVQVSRVAF